MHITAYPAHTQTIYMHHFTTGYVLYKQYDVTKVSCFVESYLFYRNMGAPSRRRDSGCAPCTSIGRGNACARGSPFRFILMDIFSWMFSRHGCFVHGCFVHGCFVHGFFVTTDILSPRTFDAMNVFSPDILSLRTFYDERFVGESMT